MAVLSRKIIGIDVDGTLTKSVCWTPAECLRAKVKRQNVRVLERLYEKNFIVIYTARRDAMLAATVKWLRGNGIPFHAISNNKIPLDLLLDDDNRTFAEVGHEVSRSEGVRKLRH